MTTDRFVLVGLAHVRSRWFTEVSRWATVGSLPVEFLKCLTVEELRSRLASGRPISAALLDARLPAVDRDLLNAVRSHGAVAIIVADPARSTDWSALGAASVLHAPFEPTDLLDALEDHATAVPDLDPAVDAEAPAPASGWRARLVVLSGGGGSGTSTLAAALAQVLADDPAHHDQVVLADLARRSHQRILHDARDVVPGIQELVEAHRTGRPGSADVRALTYQVPHRGYRLLLGLRSPRDWVAIRAEAFTAALDGLRRSARIVIADADAELEGEAETGSFDIEDRNLLARRSMTEANVVVVVCTPTGTGLCDLVRQLEDLHRFGVPPARTLVVINRAPRRSRQRAELVRTLADLSGARGRADPYVGPVFVPVRRGIDDTHHDVARFPTTFVRSLGDAVLGLLDDPMLTEAAPGVGAPVAVVPGSLGRSTDPADDPSGCA